MTLFVPVYDTPINQIGLAHRATYLELNKSTEFNSIDTIYSYTHEGEEKKSFTIAYRLRKNEIVYARYKVIFDNGLESQFSPIKIITANRAIKEYTLDMLSAVPATPVISIENYNNSNIPHEDITVKISDLRFYMGSGSLVSTSWFLKDSSDTVLWSSEKDKFNINSIVILKDNFKKDGIYKIEAYRTVRTGISEYNSLSGVKIINVVSDSGLTNEDRAIEINYDNFQLYSDRQSILEFKQKIKNFEYLSIKIYDRNGILALDEIKAFRSPVYINTTGLSLGKVYSIRTTAYYIDPITGIKNTKVTSKDFVAEKAPENNTLMTTDYGFILNLGFEEMRDYRDENIVYPELTENLNSGEAILFIRDNIAFLGQWLESGMIFTNRYINISKLNYLKTYSRLQIIQKPNGDFLCSFKKGINNNQDEIKIINFRVIDTNNNIKDIEIIQESTLFCNTNNLHNLNRFIFTNINSENIIFGLDGTTDTTLKIYELFNNSLIEKATKTYALENKLISLYKTTTGSVSILAINNNVFKAANISMSDLSSIDMSLEDIEDLNENVLSKLTEISSIGNSGGLIKFDGMCIKKNILFFSLENNSDNSDTGVFEYFKYNLLSKELSLINSLSSIGRDYSNKCIYGLNFIKTNLNKPPLRLIAES